MLNATLQPDKEIKTENKVFNYLMEDCGYHRFPFIIENAETHDNKYKAYVIVTGVKKHLGKDDEYRFEAQFFILAGIMAFSQVHIDQHAAWKFSKKTFLISNEDRIIKLL